LRYVPVFRQPDTKEVGQKPFILVSRLYHLLGFSLFAGADQASVGQSDPAFLSSQGADGFLGKGGFG